MYFRILLVAVSLYSQSILAQLDHMGLSDVPDENAAYLAGCSMSSDLMQITCANGHTYVREKGNNNSSRRIVEKVHRASGSKNKNKNAPTVSPE